MSKVTPESVFSVLQTDSANALKSIIPNVMRAYGCLDLNGITSADLLQDQPPLISIAVYHDSINSADFLIKHGADLDATDVLFSLLAMEFHFLTARTGPLSCIPIGDSRDGKISSEPRRGFQCL
jgi:hypothetical protein